ncbi:DEAD/DEAH box helicase family protein [Trichomonas vaginalis G3]|uniref:DEAD/DEAH box helicase family protein n=1 Tax=Trichomonas vaginalis (strain ATCC PRA-98 / G3) TaxID=412133 RepID=A2DKN3_TRIV3|nr:DNA polymerase theta-related family [Trichomonas vaginalis G3]EAY19016.1 DEAD/DEAH box helicase family protein [Trichomonas vaginalis G3]KAI5521191.1 DNA polymerase theta-related family [Trichomonas vaginalis G3]|eukprot:XP_001580002.1 DEAD/DEAH box helicase family protein [Trichomonas vaginalis G3]
MASPNSSEPDLYESISPEGVAISIKESKKKPRKLSKKQKDYLKSLFKKSITEIDYETDSKMNELGIPAFLQHAYLTGKPEPKITQLRDWQENLWKTPSWQAQMNTIVLVPTSGGKTVAADLAMAQVLEKDPTAKIIYALPFVALANEKYSEYEQRFFNFQVRPFYQNIGGSDFRRGNIAVCTFEKAHFLLNSAITCGYANKIKLVVIDEIHMIGDESRGAAIEALIIKLNLLEAKPRIVTLTATVNEEDANRIAKWINGFAYIWKSRPAPIKQMVKKLDGRLCTINSTGQIVPFTKLQSSPDDKDHLMPLIRTLLSKKCQSTILVFVNSRMDTIKISSLIANHMYDDTIPLPKVPPPSDSLLKKRLDLIKKMAANSGFIDDTTVTCIKNGVLFHHGGILLEDRKLIEEAARSKIINVLVATTTLSAGVNIHGVTRVIIHNIYRQTQDNRKKLIAPTQYTQMIGRAGRSGQAGESFIIARSESPVEMNNILELSKNIIPDLKSSILEGEEADRYFLQCLTIRLLPPDGVRSFIEKSFSFSSRNDLISDNKTIESYCQPIYSRLQNNNMIDSNHRTTKFGMAVAGSSLSIEEGLNIYSILNRAQKSLCIEDEVHLLYLCISSKTASSIRPISYDSPQWRKIFENHLHVIQLVTQLSNVQIDHLPDLAHIYGGNGRVNDEIDHCLDKVMVAVILQDLINERPLKDISYEYKVDLGTIQKVQMESASYAGQINRFCEILGNGVLAAALNKFRQRLNFAARTDILSLMTIPSCPRDIARTLADRGIMSPADLSCLSLNQLVMIISSENTQDKPNRTQEETEEVAKKILADAKTFADSLEKIEELEDKAIATIR